MFKRLSLLVMASLMVPTALIAATASSVTFNSNASSASITFSFDKAYEVFQYANGDWGVVTGTGGIVTITSISPAYTTGRNGWEVNPTNLTKIPYDSQDSWLDNFDPSLMPSLPYAARAGQSIVKAMRCLTRSLVEVELINSMLFVQQMTADTVPQEAQTQQPRVLRTIPIFGASRLTARGMLPTHLPLVRPCSLLLLPLTPCTGIQ